LRIRERTSRFPAIAVDNRQDGGLDATAMVPVREMEMRSLPVIGSVIGAALLCALPVSPRLLNDGSVSLAIEQAKAADLDVDHPVHRKARRQPVAYAEPVYEDPRLVAYCTGNNGGGWNGGTYRGGIFMDLNCYGYAAGDRSGEYRGWGLGPPWSWW
jgi:hypothetical protein